MQTPEQLRHSVKPRRRQDIVAAVIAAGDVRAHRHAAKVRSHKVHLAGPDAPIRHTAQDGRENVRIHKDEDVRLREHRLHQHLIPVKAVGDQPVGIDQGAEQELPERCVRNADRLEDQIGPPELLKPDQGELCPALQHSGGLRGKLMGIGYDHPVNGMTVLFRVVQKLCQRACRQKISDYHTDCNLHYDTSLRFCRHGLLSTTGDTCSQWQDISGSFYDADRDLRFSALVCRLKRNANRSVPGGRKRKGT